MTSRYWYVLDGRGNVVALTDNTGNVVNRLIRCSSIIPRIIPARGGTRSYPRR